MARFCGDKQNRFSHFSILNRKSICVVLLSKYTENLLFSHYSGTAQAHYYFHIVQVIKIAASSTAWSSAAKINIHLYVYINSEPSDVHTHRKGFSDSTSWESILDSEKYALYDLIYIYVYLPLLSFEQKHATMKTFRHKGSAMKLQLHGGKKACAIVCYVSDLLL
jgi:hypothetical protein